MVKNDHTKIIATTKRRNKLKTKMNMLQGDELPEQLIIYMKIYKDKINKNIVLKAQEKLALLKQTVDKEDNEL